MAYYTPLEDGSYQVELDNGRKLRTAVDPVEYGFELRSPEEVAGYAPQPLTAQQRLDRVSTDLDKMRRENDPDYAAFAEEQDRQREAERARGFYEQEGERLRQERDSRKTAGPAGPGADPVIPEGQSADALSKPGGFESARAPELPAERTRFVPAPQPQRAPQQSQGQGRDPVKVALSDYAARNMIRRTGPSKGGFVPTTVTTQREGVPSAEALANVEQKARDTDRIGDEAIARRAENLRANVIQPSIQAVESDLNSLRASYRQRKAVDEEQARLKKYAEDTEKKAADMPRVNARQDYWADKSAFARVLYALSAGAFQFGQALAGQSGPNLPIELTESAIADNAERLRAEHEDAIAAGKTARNAYSDHLAQFGDRESAMKALRLEGQAITDRMKSLRVAEHGSLEEQAAWEVEKAQRAEQRAREYADLSAKAAGSTVSSERYIPPSNGSASLDPKMIDLYLKLNPEASSEEKGVQLRRESLQDERAVRLPGVVASRVGQPAAFAKDKEAADKAGDALRSTDMGINALDNMEKILERGGHSILAEDRADFESQVGVLQAQLSNPLALRQQTGEELKYITGPLSGRDALNLFTTMGAEERGRVMIKRARELFRRNQDLWLRELKSDIGPQGNYIVPNVTTNE